MKNRDQINDRGTPRVWQATVLLTNNVKKTLRNVSARSYEEAVIQFEMWTNFKQFIITPHIIE